MRAVVAFMLLSAPAFAQSTACAPLEAMLEHLGTKYSEQVRAEALSAAGTMLLITADANGGWTAIEVHPDLTACIFAAGTNFSVIEPRPLGTPG